MHIAQWFQHFFCNRDEFVFGARRRRARPIARFQIVPVGLRNIFVVEGRIHLVVLRPDFIELLFITWRNARVRGYAPGHAQQQRTQDRATGRRGERRTWFGVTNRQRRASHASVIGTVPPEVKRRRARALLDKRFASICIIANSGRSRKGCRSQSEQLAGTNTQSIVSFDASLRPAHAERPNLAKVAAPESTIAETRLRSHRRAGAHELAPAAPHFRWFPGAPPRPPSARR